MKRINVMLLVTGFVMSISGLVIQFHYHLLANVGESTIWALNRVQWNGIHVWSAICFTAILASHVYKHRKWYKSVMKRGISPKQRQTMVLSLLMVVVAVTGFVALMLDDGDGRLSLIEIHDKIAILLFIILIFHTFRRCK